MYWYRLQIKGEIKKNSSGREHKFVSHCGNGRRYKTLDAQTSYFGDRGRVSHYTVKPREHEWHLLSSYPFSYVWCDGSKKEQLSKKRRSLLGNDSVNTLPRQRIRIHQWNCWKRCLLWNSRHVTIYWGYILIGWVTEQVHSASWVQLRSYLNELWRLWSRKPRLRP
jgi:hypothetical protein